MEFPAGGTTNFKVIDDFITLWCRLYCLDAPAVSVPGSAPKDGLLGHSVNVELAALTLRNSGLLVSFVPSGYGLWMFSGDGGFAALRAFSSDPSDSSYNVINVDGLNFTRSLSGNASISEIAHRYVSDPSSSLLHASSFQNQTANETTSSAMFQQMTAYALVYKAFVSALSGLLSLHATLNHDVIPLGKRTLFAASDLGSCDDEKAACSSMPFMSFLLTLAIDITAQGQLTVSWKPIRQDGLQRLSNDAVQWLAFGEDLWLAPTGTVCRYISTVRDVSSPISSKVQLWRRALSVWFQKMGQDLRKLDETLWIEVEVLNPTNYQGSGVRMSGDESGESGPTSRIFWPVSYCFRRARSDPNISGSELFSMEFEHPLDFAERWMADSVSRAAHAKMANAAQSGEEEEREGQQPKTGSPDARKEILPDTIESLARLITYPDSNAFQGVYPTPPGGSMAPHVTATAAGGLDPVATYVLHSSGQEGAAYHPDDIPSAGLQGDLDVVGSGMYDATAEDGMFGDIGDDFGASGITEADFNFFDEPEIGVQEESGTQQVTQDLVMEDQMDIPDETNLAAEPTPGAPDRGEEYLVDSLEQAPRSTAHLTDASGMGNNYAESGTDAAINKECRAPSPPLGTSQIKEILSARGTTNSGPLAHQNQAPPNHYNPIPFQESVGTSDQKYEQSGRFWFSPGREKKYRETESRDYPTDIPLLGLMSGTRAEHQKPSRRYAELTLGEDGIDIGLQSSPPSSDDSSDDESKFSVQVSESNSPSSHHSTRRRQQTALLGTSKPETPSSSFYARDVDDESACIDYSSFVGSLILEATDWPFVGYFSKTWSEIAPVLSEPTGVIQVAQLVVDQITQSTLSQGFGDVERPERSEEKSLASCPLTDTTNLLNMGEKLDLEVYSVMDNTSDATRKWKDTLPQAKLNTAPHIFKLDPPYVRLRRGDRFLETLPPAVPFWEIFGLEPLLGRKDVIAYCIYPQNAKDDADTFLERQGSTYSAASFGKHSRSGNDHGLVPWGPGPTGERDYASLMSNLQEICESLSTVLSDLPQSDENIVIYILNPFCHGAATADICSAFLRLFHRYIEDTSRRHPRWFHELVLQIVPLRFVTSPTSLVSPLHLNFLHLSLEVYSRCAPKSGSMDETGCAPPLTLAESVPKTVPFKLSSDTVSPLKDGRCFHISYSQSIDRRWITAAWTDSIGRHQTSMSYCLRERGSSVSRPVVEVLSDIWGVVQDFLGISRSYWRVLIAKDGPLEDEEITAWTALAQKQNQLKPAKVDLSLLSVDVSPALFLEMLPSRVQLSTVSQQLSQPSKGNLTPETVSKPGVPSPEPSSSASTPYTATTNLHTPSEQQQQQQQQPQQMSQQSQNALPDTDQEPTVLVDKADETWAAVLSHRLNTSNTLSSYRPAQSSGYLIRRRGTSDTEGLASLAVNVIYSQGRDSGDAFLRDVLRMYRDLATLSRTRGIAHAQGSCPLPWHIATAVKGQETLAYTL